MINTTKKSNTLKYVLIGLFTIITIVFILRISSPEDDWICQNGKWLKHGNPSVSAPNSPCFETIIISINNNKLSVEVADSDIKKEIGLGGRDSINNESGMIFVYDKPDRYSFWMKDMNFPIDIIWINENKIIEISKNISPSDYQPPNELFPASPVNKVLELYAGTVDKLNIKVGDEVK